jgi:hypothetical protein
MRSNVDAKREREKIFKNPRVSFLKPSFDQGDLPDSHSSEGHPSEIRI